MRGRLYWFILSLPLILSCSEAPEVPLIPTDRVVLAEFFTWQRCVYCPYAALTLDSLVKEFHDSVVVIAYHRRVAGDTLSPEYVEERRALYYESGGEPATVFDGGAVVRTSGPEYNYETFRNYLLGAKGVLPKAQLAISAEIDSTNGKITISAWGVDSTPQETLLLFVVVTEDSIRECLPGATDSVFNNVMRAILPLPGGKPVRLFRADTLTTEIEFQTQPFWNLDRLSAVAFIQEPGTRKVLQTRKCPIIRR
ncbi:MAG: Omp28-related outer membrane protein [candidate division WOR-3 bacterium]